MENEIIDNPQNQLANMQPDNQNTLKYHSQIKKSPINMILLLVSLLFLGATLFFGYKYYQLQKKLEKLSNPEETLLPPTSMPTIATPSTDTSSQSNWQTYENASLGFKINYPPSVRVEKEFDDEHNRAALFSGDDLNFEVMLRSNVNNMNLDTYFYMDVPITRTITLLGKPANTYELQNGYCDGGEGCGKPSITIVLQNNSELFHISFYGDTQLSELEQQILNTFEFIGDKSSSANLKIPNSINELFVTINQTFGIANIPTMENQFYSLEGPIEKNSWKLNLSEVLTDKSKINQLFELLKNNLNQDINAAADGPGSSVQGFENNQIYCFMIRNSANSYVNCAEK